jgi:predicted ATPase/transcriptional regulator with XRE-family HTH domain
METAGRTHFGALLKQFRLDAGMTQQDLAERAKLSVEAISTLERGARTRPHSETVNLLARALDLLPRCEAQLKGAVDPSRRPQRPDVPSASRLRLLRSDDEAATTRNNLPRQLTSLVGRQREVDEVAGLLRRHQLVTVVGTGGVGKTRVAVQLGSAVLDECPDGVWLVDLAPLGHERLVESTVRAALQLPSMTGSDLEIVLAHLETRRLLLILDNCEHVIDRARDMTAHIIQVCPLVRILATSRQPLAVTGEQVYRIPSLAVPPNPCRNAQAALTHGATELFVDRAVAVDASFTLTDHNAPEVVEICRRLDGIPLAIELAAARVNVLAPRQIAERLDRRFKLLTSTDCRVLPRHQTMTASIDWSYDLLTPREQRFFESLSIFVGSCTLEAAAEVCTVNEEDDDDILDLIASLVTKSLLVAELVGDDQRYRLLESSRQYAAQKLDVRGNREAVECRHATFYVRMAECFDSAWLTTPEQEWIPQVEIELGNWRAVFERTIANRRLVVLAQRLAATRSVGHAFPEVEVRSWITSALQLVDERTAPRLVAELEFAHANSARRVGELSLSLAAAERAMAKYRELGDISGIAWAQSLMGGVFGLLERREEAAPLLEEALAAARTLGNRRLTATVLLHFGNVQSGLGDFCAARTDLTEAVALAKANGAESLWSAAALGLAENEFLSGDAEAALQLTAEVLATLRTPSVSSSTVRGIAAASSQMAMYLIALTRYDEGTNFAKEALTLASRIRLSVVSAVSLHHLVVASLWRGRVRGRCTRGNQVSAARLIGFVEARRTELGIPAQFGVTKKYAETTAILQDAIGSVEFTRLTAAGAAMTEDEAIAQARALE